MIDILKLNLIVRFVLIIYYSLYLTRQNDRIYLKPQTYNYMKKIFWINIKKTYLSFVTECTQK